MGYLEVIIGSVFAGKTESLVTRLRRHQVVYRSDGDVRVFKAALDTRYSANDVVSHSQFSIPAVPIHTVDELDYHIRDHPSLKVLGLDEVQFFDDPLVRYCESLVTQGIIVIASGLHKTFQGEPFPFKQQGKEGFVPSTTTMEHLLGIADNIITVKAICNYELTDATLCKQPAFYTQRFLRGEPAPYDDILIAVGDEAERDERSYAARCREHHLVPGHPRR